MVTWTELLILTGIMVTVITLIVGYLSRRVSVLDKIILNPETGVIKVLTEVRTELRLSRQWRENGGHSEQQNNSSSDSD